MGGCDVFPNLNRKKTKERKRTMKAVKITPEQKKELKALCVTDADRQGERHPRLGGTGPPGRRKHAAISDPGIHRNVERGMNSRVEM